MTGAIKFTFDKAFDESGRKAQQQAEVRQHAEQEAMRASAFAQGVEAGRLQALESIESATQTAIEGLSAQIIAQAHSMTVAKADLMRQCADLARVIAERLAGKLIEQAPVDAIADLVEQAFAVAAREPRLVIRVADPLLDAVKHRCEGLAGAHGYAGKLIFLSEPGMQMTEARVEWADGGAERSLANHMTQIDRLVAAFIDGEQQPAETPDE